MSPVFGQVWRISQRLTRSIHLRVVPAVFVSAPEFAWGARLVKPDVEKKTSRHRGMLNVDDPLAETPRSTVFSSDRTSFLRLYKHCQGCMHQTTSTAAASSSVRWSPFPRLGTDRHNRHSWAQGTRPRAPSKAQFKVNQPTTPVRYPPRANPA